MENTKIREAFLQAEPNDAQNLLREVLRGCVRDAFWKMMQEEVDSLCGPRYRPDKSTPYHRAGSESGVFYGPEGKESIRRPRVRHETEGEVELATYEAGCDQSCMFNQVVELLGEGLGARAAGRVLEGSVSKSAAGRMWEAKSREQLAELRGRPLNTKPWMALLLDGVWLTNNICVVVAVGIDEVGNKQALDFETGSSESLETVDRLLGRLVARGFGPQAGRRLLVLRDGSAAIRGAVDRRWPEAIQQECLVHAQRNVGDRMGKKHKEEIERLFQALRQAQGKEDAQAAFDELVEYCSLRNAAAAAALREREGALLAFHRLEAPSTLNGTFLNTNIIENTLRNWRQMSQNVKRWQVKGDMVERWMASGLLWAESGFRKIRNAEDLPKLLAALACSAAAEAGASAPASTSAPQANAARA
jgi:transposase-like protein